VVACDVNRCLGVAAAPGGGLRAVPRLCVEYPGICLTTEENHGKPQSGVTSTPVVSVFIRMKCNAWIRVCGVMFLRCDMRATSGSSNYHYSKGVSITGHLDPIAVHGVT